MKASSKTFAFVFLVLASVAMQRTVARVRDIDSDYVAALPPDFSFALPPEDALSPSYHALESLGPVTEYATEYLDFVRLGVTPSDAACKALASLSKEARASLPAFLGVPWELVKLIEIGCGVKGLGISPASL